jgi:hypothetical protein
MNVKKTYLGARDTHGDPSRALLSPPVLLSSCGTSVGGVLVPVLWYVGSTHK